MTDLAPHLAAFLHDYLPQERGVSRHTIASYADSLKLLVLFVAGQRRILNRPLSVLLRKTDKGLFIISSSR